MSPGTLASICGSVGRDSRKAESATRCAALLSRRPPPPPPPPPATPALPSISLAACSRLRRALLPAWPPVRGRAVRAGGGKDDGAPESADAADKDVVVIAAAAAAAADNDDDIDCASALGRALAALAALS